MPNTSVYRNFLEMKREIEKHKWIESEKAGHDVGFDHALTNWVMYHKKDWHTDRFSPKIKEN